jgi:hypothetical protein
MWPSFGGRTNNDLKEMLFRRVWSGGYQDGQKAKDRDSRKHIRLKLNKSSPRNREARVLSLASLVNPRVKSKLRNEEKSTPDMVGRATMPIWSMTIKAAVVSSVVTGMVFLSVGTRPTDSACLSVRYLECFVANLTLNMMLIAAMPAEKITSARVSPLETFPIRNRR